MSKNLDETVGFQSERREEWVREVTGETLLGTAKGRSSTPRSANSSAVSLLGRNE